MFKILSIMIPFLLVQGIIKTAFAEVHYVRGRVLHFLRTPHTEDKTLKDGLDYQWIEDGVLEIQNGKIASIGFWTKYETILKKGTRVDHFKNGLIVPGFIDRNISDANSGIYQSEIPSLCRRQREGIILGKAKCLALLRVSAKLVRLRLC
jgi:hypothetical protein